MLQLSPCKSHTQSSIAIIKGRLPGNCYPDLLNVNQSWHVCYDCYQHLLGSCSNIIDWSSTTKPTSVFNTGVCLPPPRTPQKPGDKMLSSIDYLIYSHIILEPHAIQSGSCG